VENGAENTVDNTIAEVGHESAPKSGMPQLDISTFSSQLFWLAIAFVLFYLIVSRLIVPRISGVLENRANNIAADLAAAEKAAGEAAEAKKLYEKLSADARFSAQAEFAQAQAKIKTQQDAKFAETDKIIHARLAEAEVKLQNTRKEMQEKLAPLAQELAQDLVQKISGVAADAASVSAALKA